MEFQLAAQAATMEPMNGYSARDVATMLGLSPAQVRSYVRNGFLSPARGARGEYHFTFHDLVLLRTARELIDANIPKRKITKALRNLQEQLPNGRPLTAVRIAASDDRVVVRDGETIWSPESGQTLFDFAVSELEPRVAPFARRVAREAKRNDEEHTADEWFALGLELEIGAPDEALQAYYRAVSIDPQHSDANVNLGRMLHERGELAAAEKAYRAALDADEEHATAHYNLALLLEARKRPAEAIEAYKRSIEIDPAFADAHYNLAGLFEETGRKSLAIRHLKAYRDLVS